MTQKPLMLSFLAPILALSLGRTANCMDRATSNELELAAPDNKEGEPLSIIERGNETKRNIRRYLECKGRRCEDRFPEGAQEVEDRSPEFKEVWDTLANSESVVSASEYAERLKPKKKQRRR